jgi:hypothetical protein
MIGDALDLARLPAPWIAVAVLALSASAWVYRQTGRRVADVANEARLSAGRQGKRIGELENAVTALNLWRRQAAYALAEADVDPPYWPPDGPDQPRARRRRVDEDLDDDATDYAAPRVPVPPLPADLGARHRRPADL